MDENGEPMAMYHGTANNYTTPRAETWLTNEPAIAEQYSQNASIGSQIGENIMPLFAIGKNILTVRRQDDITKALSAAGWSYEQIMKYDPGAYGHVYEWLDYSPVRKALQQAGYDGVHLLEDQSPSWKTHESWMVFSPSQIKSATANNGTYERDDGTQGYAFVENVQLSSDPKTLNTPSQQFVVVRVNDSQDRLKLPVTQFSQFFTPVNLSPRNRDQVARQAWERSWLFESKQAIVTGNLMAALKDLNARGSKGRIISYTKQDGSQQMGILLNQKLAEQIVSRGQSQLPVPTAEDALELIQSGHTIKNQAETVRMAGQDGQYFLYVPVSRANGGKYWRDPALLRLTGEFTAQGNTFYATFDADRAKQVFDYIVNTHGERFVRQVSRGDNLGAAAAIKPLSEKARHLLGALRANMEGEQTPRVAKRISNIRERLREAGYDSDTLLEGDNLGSAEVPQPDDTERAEIIRKAKTDGTWMKAPNGKPTNLNERQWVEVRTKAFKKWFGDWEAMANDAAWKRRVADYFDNPNQRQMLPVGRVPAVLRAAGVSDAPLMMPPSVIGKATGGKHTLTREMVEQIPAALRDPIFVFDSATETDAVTALTEIKHEGRNVLAAIHLDRAVGRDDTGNLILSLYDKGAPAVQQWIKGGLLRYVHQRKARAYFQSARLQLPREGSKAGNRNLLTEHEVVNDAVNPDSVSKVVDENGEPMVVTHATNSPDFVVFRKGERPGLSGRGIYFSPEKVGIWGRNSMEVFLNIKQPLTPKNAPTEANNGGRSAVIPDVFDKYPQFDGVLLRRDEITVKAPNQIKSATANNGNYDSTDDNILHAAEAPRLGVEDDPDFNAALDQLNSRLPSDTELAELWKRAGWDGTQNESDIAANLEGVRGGIRSAYDEQRIRQTHEEWTAAARRLIAKDRAGVLKKLADMAANGEIIANPILVKCSMILNPQIMANALISGNRQAMTDAASMSWAYDIAGTEVARSLAARFQPGKTPEERHREMLTKAILTPGEEARNRIKKAKSPGEKARRLKQLEEELARVKQEAQATEASILSQVSKMTEELRREIASIRRKAKAEIEKLRAELAAAERAIQTSNKNTPRLVWKTVWVRLSSAGVKSNTAQVYTPGRPLYGPLAGGEVNPDSVSKVVDENGEPIVMYHGTNARCQHSPSLPP
ncbi:MAG: hypothetical protein JNJ83_23340 [Verrucomicrobiaceae bacterium]|nr:hypothetical protein [Verrucomicrobiaceae bacterium]